MKKLLALTLAALLLTGCTAEPLAPTEPSIAETTPATEPEIVISYDSLELLEFDYEDVFAAAPLGEDLLLLRNMDATTLTKVSGRNHKELACVDTGVPVNPDSPALRTGESGVCYASGDEHIFLDANLEEVKRISLPGAYGRRIVSADQQAIYYSTGSELWVCNVETGLKRLLRETMHTDLALENLVLEDSVLVCQTSGATVFYSAVTGELLGTYEDTVNLTSAVKLWLAKTSDGQRNQIVLGGEAEPQTLTGWESFSDVMLTDGGVLIKNGGTIRFLDPQAGTEAAMALEQDTCITNIWHSGGILWIALDDGRLCRWELGNAETQAISCFAPYYNRENPDTEGLAALEPVIADLENTYGVAIHIYEDAVAVQSEDMMLHSEYQVDTLAAALEELKLALSPFTPEFLAKAGKSSADGMVHISIVRSVSSEGCIQFWDADGTARIILTAGADLQRSFFHGLAHIIDARVMTKTTAFDGWKNLNPKDFRYSYDFSADADTAQFPGAFADPIGTVSPVEDRAAIFAAAMAGDGTFFENETAQRKLSTLCNGIRKAFGLKDSGESFLWEQYLSE